MIFEYGAANQRRSRIFLWLVSLLLSLAFSTTARAQSDEFRAVWVDAWGTGFLNTSQVSQLVADARANNFNALLVQMRRRGDAFYVPLAGNDPKTTAIASNYDALADIIAKAHSGSPRLEVHCWVTTQVIWGDGALPSNPAHVVRLHPEYLMKDSTGSTAMAEGLYLDPGHPEAARWNYAMATNIVRRYDVDGFHWDYIRYPQQNSGYNDTAIARYKAEFGLTDNPAPDSSQFSAWRRRQVTDFLRWANAELLGIKPNLVVSTAVFGSRSDAYTYRFQDWAAWNSEGLLDLCIPMIYSSDNSVFTTRANDAFNNQGVRRVYPGPGAYLNTKENTVWQLNYSRSKPFLGTSFYSYRVPNSGTVDRPGTLGYLKTNYQPSWVNTPVLPWKSVPTKGLIKGYVTRSDNGAVLYNATVKILSSPQRQVLSEAHGHYAFFEAQPGTYTITATTAGLGTVTNTITVTAGGVLHRDLVVPATDNTPPVISSVAARDIVGATARITWTTDDPANTAVDYGTTISYDNTATNADFTTSHSITLSNLGYDTLYHYRVRSRNTGGLSVSSGDFSFRTLPQGVYNDVIVESRLSSGALNSNPPYVESGAWSDSTLKSLADGLTGTGSRYVVSGTPGYSLKPALPLAGATYDVFITHGSAGSLSDDLMVSVTTSGGTGLPASSGILAQAGGGTWEYLGRIVLDPGVAVPVITLTYQSGTLDSAGNGRMYSDAAKFVFVSPPPPLPAIAQQPQDKAVIQGASALFNVTTEANPAPISYRWHFEGSAIPGATSSSYTRANAQPAHEGEYTVVLSNVTGSVTSAPALLTVYIPPSFALEPQGQTVAVGGEVSFETTVGGSEPFHYQWFFNGYSIEGANEPSFTRLSAMNTHAGGYSVQVTNFAGSVTSSVANLVVVYPGPPEVSSISRFSEQTVQLDLAGGPGQFRIEASHDLATWTNRALINTTNSTFIYQDVITGNARLFFRIKRDP